MSFFNKSSILEVPLIGKDSKIYQQENNPIIWLTLNFRNIVVVSTQFRYTTLWNDIGRNDGK